MIFVIVAAFDVYAQGKRLYILCGQLCVTLSPVGNIRKREM